MGRQNCIGADHADRKVLFDKADGKGYPLESAVVEIAVICSIPSRWRKIFGIAPMRYRAVGGEDHQTFLNAVGADREFDPGDSSSQHGSTKCLLVTDTCEPMGIGS